MKIIIPFFIVLLILTVVSCKPRTPKRDLKNDTLSKNDTGLIKNPYDTFSYGAYDEIACFLAGKLPQGKPEYLYKHFKKDSWKNYSVQFSATWEGYRKSVISEVQQWSGEHLQYGDTIFYPFSGPDFNYLNAMFPKASYAVMIGLEKTGSIPEPDTISGDSITKYLASVNKALYFNLKLSFFRTKSMRNELDNDMVNGTIPLIMLFMNRHGKYIVNINPIEVNAKGELQVTDTANEFAYNFRKKFDYGVEFVYRDSGDVTLKKLVYLSLDLSNDGLDTDAKKTFVSSMAHRNTVFMKAASYLCFIGAFTNIRDAILNNAAQIVTDPSGMPYIHLRKKWNVDLYGEYTGPINLFKGFKQPELKADIDSLKPGKLPFIFGYHPSHWCMVVARRK